MLANPKCGGNDTQVLLKTMAAALLSLTDCCQPCDACSGVEEDEDDDGGGEGVVGWFKVITLAAGLAIPTNSTNVYLTINGFEPGGDGFAGVFTWNNTSVSAHDGANVLQPSDLPAAGRWHRQI